MRRGKGRREGEGEKKLRKQKRVYLSDVDDFSKSTNTGTEIVLPEDDTRNPLGEGR